MTRTDEAENFFAAVYQAVQEIPAARVTSYGHIARLIGRPQCPRQVGICLKHLPDEPASRDALYWSDTVPWQRVINAKGVISPRGHANGATRQAEALRAEGVEVEQGNMGELTVDFSLFGWFPDVLPSDAEAESSV